MEISIAAATPAPTNVSPGSPGEFFWRLRVYYEDTDTGGVVFYANYLKFFERARTEWLRAAGVGQQSMTEENGVMFIVKSTAVDYHAPARLDDELMISVVVQKMGRASVHFVQQAWRLGDDGPQLLCSGRIKVGCVNTTSFRPDMIPAQVLARIRAVHG
jgi:acyl-CoA thioester hydrolase